MAGLDETRPGQTRPDSILERGEDEGIRVYRLLYNARVHDKTRIPTVHSTD